jgi:hypothetical protein
MYQQLERQEDAAPVLDSVEDKNIDEGKLLEFQVKAYDPDLVMPRIEAFNLPEGATFEEPGEGIPISTYKELQSMADNLSGSYYLTNDIKIPEGINFTPIGTYNQNRPEFAFSGKFNGCGYAISNLRCAGGSGLFGWVHGPNAEVKNIALLSADVSGAMVAGVLAGIISDGALIKDVYAHGRVKSSYAAGGITGCLAGGRIESSFSSVTVEGPNYTGGLVGYMFTGVVKKDYTPSIVNSCANGAVNNNGRFSLSRSGGLIGWCFRGNVTNSYAVGKVTGGVAQGGLIGVNSDPVLNIIQNSYWDIDTTGQSESAGGEGKTTAQMLDESTYLNWDMANVWAKCVNSYPSQRFLGTKTKVFRWTPSCTQGGITSYVIEFAAYDSAAILQNLPDDINPPDPDDRIDVRITVNDTSVIAIELNQTSWILENVNFCDKVSNCSKDGMPVHQVKNAGNIAVDYTIRYTFNTMDRLAMRLMPGLEQGIDVYVTWVKNTPINPYTETYINRLEPGKTAWLELTYGAPTGLSYFDIDGMSAGYELRAYPADNF